jgi:uncharacterized protein YfkK (UPF0435 family)
VNNPTPKQLLCQNKALKQCLEEAEQKIKELEQQLAAKPRYTKEQIEAVKDFEAWVSRRHNLSGEFNWWLKEVGND